MTAALVIALSIASTLSAGLAADGLRHAFATRTTWLALAGNLVVVPLIAWLVLPAFASGASLVGLLLVAAAPGGAIGPLLAILGRGDAAFAGALFLVLSLAGTAIVLVVTAVVAADTLRAAGLVATTALAPLGLGLAIRRRAPHLAHIARPWTARLGALLLVATIAMFAIRHGAHVTASTLAAAGVLAATSVSVGWLAARGAPRAIVIAVVEISLVRNVALGLVVATGLGAAPGAVMGILTYALVMLVGGATAAGAGAARSTPRFRRAARR